MPTQTKPAPPAVRSDPGGDLLPNLERFAHELGFNAVGVSSIDLSDAEARLIEWLNKGFHGEMHYMHRHGSRRSRPEELEPGTVSVISVRMNYLPEDQSQALLRLDQAELAYISRYALGRDYHKLMRRKLKQLAEFLAASIGEFSYRVYTDSAPVLEKPIAANAGLGWVGKHTNLIDRNAGSWFFLGEIYTDLPLPPSQAVNDHCGDCVRCQKACPTDAIVAPYVLDARRCISYLTIEHKGAIPLEFRKAMGNRVYGCDDCQLVCPWNRFAPVGENADFAPRHSLDKENLLSLWSWTEAEFLQRFEGSPIRRIGYQKWLSNLAIGLGNAPRSTEVVEALRKRRTAASALLSEHIDWALQEQGTIRSE